MLTNANTKPTTKGRRAERAPVQARARFREPGFNPFDVELYDLSSTGFRMVTFSRPQIGKAIWVSLPGLQPLEAIIRRALGHLRRRPRPRVAAVLRSAAAVFFSSW